MLYELRVENLLLMEKAELRLGAGLNVLTGETGAGKTLLAQALDLLLGGRARSGIVRAGAAEAYVEGIFARPPELPEAIAERLADDADELVVARRVWPDGRTRAYIDGRSATVGDLREIGGRLLAFYGQHEHRKLMLAGAQLEVLDDYCGTAQRELRARTARAYERVRRLRERAAALQERSGARERELDLVAFELEEIETIDPSEPEQHQLLAERDRLRNIEALRLGAALGADALVSEDGGGAAAALAQAVAQLEPVAGIDSELAPLVDRLRTVRYEAEDLGSELRRYLLGLEAEPGRLEEVEERLGAFARLERKHGGSIAEVLRHAERCRARREELQNADVALEAAQAELQAAEQTLDELASELGARRREAAPVLARAVRSRLAELAMSDAEFEVEVRQREDGCGPRGSDAVEFRIAPNPGMPAGALREIASGGELSRLMLALLSVAHGDRSGEAPDERRDSALLVFDEIDAGIGGHTARAVGEHLRALAQGRQILCITHLPQVAAVASRHYTIVKDSSTAPAHTEVIALDGEAVVGELVRMLGAGKDDSAASEHARQLLHAA